jgi:hypothetical protein
MITEREREVHACMMHVIMRAAFHGFSLMPFKMNSPKLALFMWDGFSFIKWMMIEEPTLLIYW